MQLIRKYKTNQQLSDSTPPPFKQKLLQILKERVALSDEHIEWKSIIYDTF